MGLLNQLRPKKLRQMFATPSAKPMYVLNVLRYRKFSSYRWYGMFVMPTVLMMGGRPMWAGKQAASIAGEPICDSLLVMRYPSHQRFLTMVLNPYYALINFLRDAGVETFEGSFNRRLTTTDDDILHAPWVLAVHFNSDNAQSASAAMVRTFDAAGARHVLTLQEYLTLEFLEAQKPNDPNPLTYKINQFYRLEREPDVAQLRTLAQTLGSEVSVQLYALSKIRDYLPGMPMPKPVRFTRPLTASV